MAGGWGGVGCGGMGWGALFGERRRTRWRVLFVGLGASRGGLPAPTLKVADSLCFAVKALLLSAENRERVLVWMVPCEKVHRNTGAAVRGLIAGEVRCPRTLRFRNRFRVSSVHCPGFFGMNQSKTKRLGRLWCVRACCHGVLCRRAS